MNKLSEHQKGEFAEGMPWEIVSNTDVWNPKYLCKHCSEDGHAPYTIEANNEAGHNGTSVCLLCILEAAAEIGLCDTSHSILNDPLPLTSSSKPGLPVSWREGNIDRFGLLKEWDNGTALIKQFNGSEITKKNDYWGNRFPKAGE